MKKQHDSKCILRGILCLSLLFTLSIISEIYGKDNVGNIHLSAYQQQVIKGTVLDSKGVPLPGVSVLVKNKKGKGVATDFDGNYSIEVSPNDVLVFSFIGFVTQEIPVKGKTKINVTLKDDVQDLEEVVVVGFGTQKKENLTGSVATVDTKVLESRPVSNAVQALQGAVAGMNFNVGGRDTELGGSPNINVRGAGTIGGNTTSSPLVLIDGAEGNLSTINPQDIESISVLKDAASASIYGSRAAFGVILVTTKSGKEGKVSINYSQNFRMSTPTLIPNMLDSEEFAYYRNDGELNAGIDASRVRFRDALIEKIKKYKRGELKEATEWVGGRRNDWRFKDAWANVNWYEEYYRNWAPTQEHNLTINGGTKGINYYISANYLDQEGLLRHNTDTYNRIILNGKVSAQLKKWLKLSYSARYTDDENGAPSFSKRAGRLYHEIARQWPNSPVYDNNGNYLTGSNIPYINMGRNTVNRNLLVQQLGLVFSPIENWNTYINMTYRVNNSFATTYYLPVYGYDEEGLPYAENPKIIDNKFGAIGQGVSAIIEEASNEKYFSPNIYSEYSKNLGNHYIKAMVGFQSELTKSRYMMAARDQFVSRSKVSINTTDGANPKVGGSYDHWATAGFFGRLNYNYDQRYLLEFNLRYDGTSRFLRNQRWNMYPSASFGWNVAKEKFWKKLDKGILSEINTFKFRISYGELGNQNTRNRYPFYLSMPFRADSGKWLINGIRPNTAWAPSLNSETLTWETVATTNLGLDITAFKNRFNLSLDVFQRDTKNMIGPAPELPATFGFRVPDINNADLRSQGFELSIGWNDRIKDFYYSVNATLTDSRQKVTKYNNVNGRLFDSKGRYLFYEGKDLGEIWGFVTHGIAKTDKEMQDWLKNHKPDFGGAKAWAAGDIMYEDLDNSGTITKGNMTLDNPGDMKIIGNETPRYNFGLNISMRYKAVDFSMFIQGTAKRDFYPEGNLFLGQNANKWQGSAFKEHLDYFRPENTKSPFGPNTDAYFPRPLVGDAPSAKGLGEWRNFQTQTRFLQDASYVRLKNIQVGYTFPSEIMNKVGINKLRIYFSAENILTYTKLISIFDPEAISEAGYYAGSGKMYPLSKVISTGLSVTF